jgi:hypothetical protein
MLTVGWKLKVEIPFQGRVSQKGYHVKSDKVKG